MKIGTRCPNCGGAISTALTAFTTEHDRFLCSQCDAKLQWNEKYSKFLLISNIIAIVTIVLINDYLKRAGYISDDGFIPGLLTFLGMYMMFLVTKGFFPLSKYLIIVNEDKVKSDITKESY